LGSFLGKEAARPCAAGSRPGVQLAIVVYEDDTQPCKIVQDKDYVKLATDARSNSCRVRLS
jgi:hypothetical protein